jgi:hypothetical protein
MMAAGGDHTVPGSPPVVNGEATAAASSSSSRESSHPPPRHVVSDEMLYKLSKKIAQLTKVGEIITYTCRLHGKSPRKYKEESFFSTGVNSLYPISQTLSSKQVFPGVFCITTTLYPKIISIFFAFKSNAHFILKGNKIANLN